MGLNENSVEIRKCQVCGKPLNGYKRVGERQFYFDTLLCDCEKKRREELDKARRRKDRIRDLVEEGFFHKSYRESTFGVDRWPDTEGAAELRNYARHFSEMSKNSFGMLLLGDLGGGKTFYACCIANDLIDSELRSVLLYPLYELVDEYQNYSTMETIKKKIRECDLMIIDDFMLRDARQVNTVYEIITMRYDAKKPLIVTANITPSVLTNEQDLEKRRIYSRLIQMCSYVYSFYVDTDRRVTIGRENYKAIEGILRDPPEHQ